ncbi:hypothetical protein VTN02DRAFT_5621 [Thermoascus thermophilus]
MPPYPTDDGRKTKTVTGPVARFARQIAGQGYICAAPSIYHEFTGPEPLKYDAEDTDKGNLWKVSKVCCKQNKKKGEKVLHCIARGDRKQTTSSTSPPTTKTPPSPWTTSSPCRPATAASAPRACVWADTSRTAARSTAASGPRCATSRRTSTAARWGRGRTTTAWPGRGISRGSW